MRTPQTVPVIAALLLAIPAPAARAAAPANDSFASPTIVSGLPATATGSNVDATLQANESLPAAWGGDGEASVWFRWTAPTSGAVRIDTFGSDFDTMLAVWTGTAVNALTLLAENDEYNGSQSAVFLSAVAGTTYQIGVYGWIDARGAIALHITNDTTSKITGTVTGPDDVTPLAGIWAQAWQWNADWEGWDYVVEGETDADGNYAIQGLLAGTYRVRFIDYDENYVAEIYSNAPDFDAGTDIVVPAATTVSNINAGLATAAGISGTVWGPDGITPLENIQVTVYHQVEGGWTGYATWTDAVGNYLVGGLTGGTYRVWFEGGSYISEAYSNAPSLDAGMDIVVPAGTVVSNINASLAAASGISGTVTGPDGVTPLEGHWIQAYRWNADWEEWDWIADNDTDENGFYSIRGLTPGTYRVWFNGGGNYVSEAYSNAPSLDAGMDVGVPAGTTVSNINAALATAAGISGTVTGPDGITPLEGISAQACQWNGVDWDWVASDNTDADGRYSIGGLTAATYRVWFYDENDNYLSEAYSNAPSLDAGMDIVVPFSTTVSNINAALATASKISGTVTGPDGITPLEDISAQARQWNGETWSWVASDDTDADGRYSIGGLTAATYRVWFYDGNDNYLSEAYSNAPSLDAGMDIAVPAGATVSNINASLSEYSTISGTVTGPDGTTPLEGIQVYAYQWYGFYWNWLTYVNTDASGHYIIPGLTAATYRVWFFDGNGTYLPEAYSNAPSLDDGMDVVVPFGASVSDINASLSSGGTISGTVTGPDGTTPLENITAYARHWNGEAWDWAIFDNTDASGHYVLQGLTTATYRVWFYDNAGNYIPEAYSNAPTVDDGMDIAVIAGATISNINASLAAYASISGTVTGPDGITPLGGIMVYASHWNGEYWDTSQYSDYTDANGQYFIGGMTAGTYRVWFHDWSMNYIAEAHSNAPTLDAGTDIVLSVGEDRTGIDASLARYSTISGTVTGPDGTTPLQGVGVYIYKWDGSGWSWFQSYSTEASGNYNILGLTAGTYRVWFDAGANYVSEAYSNAPTVDSGMDIVVPAGTTISNINATLAPSGSFPSQLLRIRNMGTGAFALSVTGTPDRVYMAQWAASLTGSWVNVGWAFYPGDDAITLTPTGPAGFWRIILAP